MQRIARGCFLAALLLAGCESPQRNIQRPPPEPPLATRQPVRTLPPLPPPPAPLPPRVTPAPKPAPPAGVTLNTAELVPARGIQPGRWKVIVVHHSANPKDTPSGMDNYHRNVRGWSGGLGYHFVIGNGVGYPDGKVFVGQRWKLQDTGAHCKAGAGKYFGTYRPNNFFNSNGIGICLIGNFENGPPTPRQLATLQQLVQFLCGKTRINPAYVYGHGEVTNKTACPGRTLRSQLVNVRRSVAQALAVSMDVDPELWLALGAYLDGTPCPYDDADGGLFDADGFAELCDVDHALAVDCLEYVADADSGAARGTVLDHIQNDYAVAAGDFQPRPGFWREIGQAQTAP
jgi:hypothetical protein